MIKKSKKKLFFALGIASFCTLLLSILLLEGMLVRQAIAAGQPQFAWMIPSYIPSYLDYPTGLAVDGNGDIHVVNSGSWGPNAENYCIKRFTADGNFLNKWDLYLRNSQVIS